MSGVSFSVNESTNKYLSTMVPPINTSSRCRPVSLNVSNIMSTNEYTTYCSPSFKDFKAKRGFLFSEIKGDGFYQVFKDPNTYVSQVSTGNYDPQSSLNFSFEDLPERHKLIKPNIHKFRLYTLNTEQPGAKEEKPDFKLMLDSDIKAEIDDNLYSIILKKDLHMVEYDGRLYWRYVDDKLNGHPRCIFFTNKNNFMTLLFSNGVRKNIFIDTNPLKLYKLVTKSGNTRETSKTLGKSSGIDPLRTSSLYTISDNSVEITSANFPDCVDSGNADTDQNMSLMGSDDYIVSKTCSNCRLYRMKPGVPCCMCKYHNNALYTHKEGDPLPDYVLCDYLKDEVQIKCKDQIHLFSERNDMTLVTKSLTIPNITLYSSDTKQVLSDQDYYLQVIFMNSFNYLINQGVNCGLVEIEGKKIWSHKQGAPFPYCLTYHTEFNEFRICFHDGYALFTQTDGKWVLTSASDNIRPHL
ncbi:uncharacterized protein TA04470 [Theileria annulata]|uniref:Uncharacterized protein n=1 Tax=Theileria annulata TaxID=5874 RepID=Q4UC18_THEAN|nr:uncharacterized protein TA04470 [Theileria annulata]CAI75633.1 hypothetical protein TA04470 [Theileria annulata]|eukprot:XP_955109.1 hypothetical protein TA04470 [Theileria annulata]